MCGLTASFSGAIVAPIAITARDGQRALFGRAQVERPGRQVWQPQRLLLGHPAGNANREVGSSRLGPFPGSPTGWHSASTESFVMPVLSADIKETTLAAHKQLSYESLLAAWLSGAGWEVLVPMVDHGKKTDLVICDAGRYYRIQVKTVGTRDESTRVYNKWQGALLDYVIYFSTEADWGYIAPAFAQASRPLNAPDHVRFHCHPTNFIKAFKRV